MTESLLDQPTLGETWTNGCCPLSNVHLLRGEKERVPRGMETKEWKGGLEAMDDVGMPCHRPCPESSKTSQASHTDQHSHLYVSRTFGAYMPDIAVLLLPCSLAASVATTVTSTPGKTLSPAPIKCLFLQLHSSDQAVPWKAYSQHSLSKDRRPRSPLGWFLGLFFFFYRYLFNLSRSDLSLW